MKAEVAKTPVCLKAKVAKTTEKPNIRLTKYEHIPVCIKVKVAKTPDSFILQINNVFGAHVMYISKWKWS